MSIAEIVAKIPKIPGVYMMKDESGKIIYIGKAKSLKDRVSSYFRESADHQPKIALMVKQVIEIDYLETESEVDALILESRLIKDIQPKYNTRQKDSKSYPFIIISKKEDFPRVMIAREHEFSRDEYKAYGPFVDSYGLKNSFKLLQRIFKFRTCELDIKEGDKRNRGYRPCLLAAIKYCTAPCGARIDKERYKKDIQRLERFLQGKRKKLLNSLDKEMQEAAKNWNYEEAAYLRDQIKAIESLDKQGTMGDFIPSEFLHVDPKAGLKMLQEVLQLEKMPRIVEGIDIAHHGGKEAVGSLVAFIDGVPYKEGYRRYKIQSQYTNDDYTMLKEVFRRRFTGQDKERTLPDIFLVDGGKGQLRSVLSELIKNDVPLPVILSLAKKREEIYLPESKHPLDIPMNSVAHHLLCYVRDEAHRFAQSYHHFLKSRKLQGKDKKGKKEKK